MQLRLIRNIRLGVKNLLLHKLRSMLTMLGVVFGVGSVVAMLSVGEGASQDALERIRRLGSTNIIITSIKPVDEETSQQARVSVYGLSYEDEQRIRDLPGVERTVPVKLIRRDGRLGERALELRVVGTTPDWFDLVQRPIVAGRTLLQRDMDGLASVVVLTEHGVRRLLATENSIGQSVRIGNDHYEVIGIVKSEESSGSFQTPDERVDAYIPMSVARARVGDITVRRSAGSMEREMVELHQLIVEVHSVDAVVKTAAAIDHALQRFHPKNDYRMYVPLALLQETEATKRTMNIVLGSIAGISLLVGGIGIMNIMLASVTERTREIGIRRAIGARKKQIVVQFLIETVVLSMVGGMIGIGVGVAIPGLITYFAEMPTVVTAWSLALAVGISMLVGVFFGLYPAFRAANLDPIVALRHE